MSISISWFYLDRGGWIRTWLRTSLMICLLPYASAFNCSEKCSCKWRSGKMTAFCENAGFTSLPKKIDEGVQVLNISKNSIKILPKEAFVEAHLVNLQKLYMSYCDISVVEDSAFNRVTNLVELDLSYNKLQNIPSASMTQLKNLRILNLRGNLLNKVLKQAFVDLKELKELELSECNIDKISEGAFEGLDKLQVLKLEFNRLTTLPQELAGNQFKAMHRLTLHENAWECDCHLRALRIKLAKQALTDFPPKCYSPIRLSGKVWTEISENEFACPPRILPDEGKTVTAISSENVNLNCCVSSVPRAEIEWYRSSELLNCNTSKSRCTIEETSKVIDIYTEQTSVLTLYSVDSSLAGSYSCVATNPSGKVRQNFTVHVVKQTIEAGPVRDPAMPGLAQITNGRDSDRRWWLYIFHESPLTGLIIGVVLGAFAVICTFGSVFWVCKRYRTQSHHKRRITDEATKLGDTSDVSKESDCADLKLLNVTQTKAPPKPPRTADYRSLQPLNFENSNGRQYVPSGCVDDSGTAVWIVRDHVNSQPYGTLPRDRRSVMSSSSSLRSPLAVPAPMIPDEESNVLQQIRLHTELAQTLRKGQRPISDAGSESSTAPLLNFTADSDTQSPYEERPPSSMGRHAPDLLMNHDQSSLDIPPSMPLMQPTVWNGSYMNCSTNDQYTAATYFRSSPSGIQQNYCTNPPTMLPTVPEVSDGTEV